MNDELLHTDYPHEPGRLPGCPACDARCHCDRPAVLRGEVTTCCYDGHPESLAFHAAHAARLVAGDDGDVLVVLEPACEPIPGEQDDDGVRAIAAVQLLRHLIDYYEEGLR